MIMMLQVWLKFLIDFLTVLKSRSDHTTKNIYKKVKELGRGEHKALVGFGKKAK
jgi:hypothetical protein